MCTLKECVEKVVTLRRSSVRSARDWLSRHTSQCLPAIVHWLALTSHDVDTVTACELPLDTTTCELGKKWTTFTVSETYNKRSLLSSLKVNKALVLSRVFFSLQKQKRGVTNLRLKATDDSSSPSFLLNEIKWFAVATKTPSKHHIFAVKTDMSSRYTLKGAEIVTLWNCDCGRVRRWTLRNVFLPQLLASRPRERSDVRAPTLHKEDF